MDVVDILISIVVVTILVTIILAIVTYIAYKLRLAREPAAREDDREEASPPVRRDPSGVADVSPAQLEAVKKGLAWLASSFRGRCRPSLHCCADWCSLQRGSA